MLLMLPVCTRSCRSVVDRSGSIVTNRALQIDKTLDSRYGTRCTTTSHGRTGEHKESSENKPTRLNH
jgi:hypothetical protein